MNTRWALKKTARFSVALASGLGRLRGRGPASVRVLMYHRIRVFRRDPFSVAPDVFERQVAWLAEQRIAVSLDSLRRQLMGQQPFTRDAVLVTIDDGYRDLYTAALPILARHRVPAVAFVTVSGIETRTAPPTDGHPEARCSWGELAELLTAGIDVASHGMDHVSMARLRPEGMVRQARESRAMLEHRLSTRVDAFAYPFGTRRDFSPRTARVLSDAGYRFVFTAQHGAVHPMSDPLHLPRVKIEGGEGMWMFRRVVHGGLDPWSIVDRTFSRLQSSERTHA